MTLREKLLALLEKEEIEYTASIATDYDNSYDVDLNIDLAGLFGFTTAEYAAVLDELKRLNEALFPRPEIKDAASLILYFDDKNERDEFVALVQEAKPGMRSYKVE